MKQVTYYIRGSGTDKSIALVKVWVDDWMPELTKVNLAIQEALEQGCYPDNAVDQQVGNARVIREVVEQHPSLYNRKISPTECRDPNVMALVR